ncbi:MAG: hypothetical protein QOF91_3325 [Alphaproteobacteria bacterium]|nr:hypothetical protein [Alphaproteobacteria bacterium]
MFQTKITFSEGQTPEQRKAHTAYWRRQDAQRRGFNNMLRFWRVCARPACRRNHTCSGDMHACFTRHWAMMAEDEKEWIRGAIKAGAGATLEQRARAADAARERSEEHRARQCAARAVLTGRACGCAATLAGCPDQAAVTMTWPVQRALFPSPLASAGEESEFRFSADPSPGSRSDSLRAIHPLPQGERGSEFAALV